MQQAHFRFYAELNDPLPLPRRGESFSHAFEGAASVKDTIEAFGVPHTEVDLILVNGKPDDFDDVRNQAETGGQAPKVFAVESCSAKAVFADDNAIARKPVINLADEPMLGLDLEPLEAFRPEALRIAGEKQVA